jgi:RNA polymerase sigma-70 factor (ECF subfamily)
LVRFLALAGDSTQSKESAGKDEILVLESLKKGSQESFEFLFKKYSERLFIIARQYLKDPDEALDVVQEVFAKVWINSSKIKPDLPFAPFIIRIAKNLILNRVKRKLIEKAHLQSLEKPAGDLNSHIEEDLQAHEMRNVIQKSIACFPPKRKEVFVLSRSHGFSIKQIAERMSISESTVQNHINQALKSLRKELRRAGYFLLALSLISLTFFS